MPRNSCDLPLVVFITMLADPVLAGRANIAIGEVGGESEHGQQPANLPNPLLELDNPRAVLDYPS